MSAKPSRSESNIKAKGSDDMPEIEFSIDTESGECQTEIKGIKGALCEKTASEIKRLLGHAAIDKKTSEFFSMNQIHQQETRKIARK